MPKPWSWKSFGQISEVAHDISRGAVTYTIPSKLNLGQQTGSFSRQQAFRTHKGTVVGTMRPSVGLLDLPAVAPAQTQPASSG